MLNMFNWIVVTSQILIIFQVASAEQVVIKAGSMDNGWFNSALEVGRGGQLWTNPKREGDDHSHVCGQGTDSLLIASHLPLGRQVFAQVIYVDVDADFPPCPPDSCDNYYFEVYLYREKTAPSFPGTKQENKKYFEDNFVAIYNITNQTSQKAPNKRENQTFTFLKLQSEGVTFGIRSRGACGSIYRIKVYYYYCKETLISGVEFNDTVAPAQAATEVFAQCSENSSPRGNAVGLKGYCQSDGRWKIPNGTMCFCNKGFERNTSSGCSACRVNQFRPDHSSNAKCRPCPLNNIATKDRSDCKCKDNHYKPYQSTTGPCYALPQYALELKINSLVGTNVINITWNTPKLQGQWNETLKYDVMCYRCLTGNRCNGSCGEVVFTPSNHSLNQTFVQITNLELESRYAFRVYPINTLNYLVERNKWNYTEITDYLKSAQSRHDRMNDKGFWPYIYVVAAACAVLFLTVIILVIIILKRRANFKRGLIIKNRNQVELPSIGHRCYIDPTIYDSPEDALSEFASELERSVVVLDMLIGGGEFGDVYKGQMSCSNGCVTPVAVKTLKQDANAKNEKDFLLEASIMAQFNDPNVIKLEGVITKSIPRMIVIEFMSNGSLDHFLKNNDNKLSRLQLIAMARGVASGMKYLAKINFVHRDLAARNILVNERLFCKISDFGLSRALETEGSRQGVYSTSGGKIPIRWTAPEAIEYRKFSSASDVWSYGILLWEIMSFAERPYGQWDNFRVMREVDEGYRLPAPQGCPKAVHDLMLRCWNSYRLERPKFDDILCTIDEWMTTPDMLRDPYTSNDLSDWLQSIKMGSYTWHLIAAGYRTPAQLSDLQDGDLKAMGITLIGHRNKILKGIKAMQSKKGSDACAGRQRLSSVAV